MNSFRSARHALALGIAFGLAVSACTSSGPVPPAEPRTRAEQKREDAAPPTAAAPMAAKGVHGYMLDGIRPPSAPLDRENYAHFDDNPVKSAAEQPVSTFSIDVDTGAYANARRFLNAGRLPPSDAVRVEEMINYFPYDYPAPADRSRPFSVTTEIAPAPWKNDALLLRIGIQGYAVAHKQLPPANLVFLVDVSGSMNMPNKLPLVKSTLKLLTQQLRAQDRVSIVVYAGATGVVLEPTPGNRRARIEAALDALSAGGPTHGAAGIQLAYSMAEQAYIKGGINRVLLATDGDFNVGVVNFEQLLDLIKAKRKSGIALTTLGFGMGNYNDKLMERLADAGNGNYAYIDTLNEAQKVLVDQLASTAMVIAKDVKVQVEFNPALVAEYRLIGYENRMLKREDFSNDQVDAGEIGAGHSVTALYEIVPVGGKGARLEPLRYQKAEPATPGKQGELAFLRLRYKLPDQDQSRLLEIPIERASVRAGIGKASDSFRFAAAVAGFGQLLRGGTYTGDFGYDEVAKLARGARGEDRFGYRGEFLSLINLAKSLDASAPNRLSTQGGN